MALPNSQDQLTALCILMFDAAPGADILADLVSAYDAGASIVDIANVLATKPQFEQVYYTPWGAREMARQLVERLLTDDMSFEDRYWVENWVIDKLEGGESMVSVLLQAGEALLTTTNPAYASAQAQLFNKIDVAEYFSVTKEQSRPWLNKLQQVLSDVTSDPASVTAAKAAIDYNIGGTEERVIAIDAMANQVLDIQASTAALTLQTITDNDGIHFTSTVYVEGDAKEMSFLLVPAIDNAGTADPGDDGLDKVGLLMISAYDQIELAEITLRGNGQAVITNFEGMALTLIDASQLSNRKLDGSLETNYVLSYNSTNTKAETLKLGAGMNPLQMVASSVLNMDTIYNFDLIEDATHPGKMDMNRSDYLFVGVRGFVTTVIEAGSMKAALNAAAASTAGDRLVFHFDGDTYVYQDSGTTMGASDDADFLIRIVGEMDLALLVDSLNT
jgi:hypothetical protein